MTTTRTITPADYSDSRAALFIRACRMLDLDPIDAYLDHRDCYELTRCEHSDPRPTICILSRAITTSDDDTDYFNFELHMLLRRCFSCDADLTDADLILDSDIPFCYDCAPDNIDPDDDDESTTCAPHTYPESDF